MSKNQNSDLIEFILTITLSILAFSALRSIFENDNSKIVSKKGRAILSNPDKLDEISKKLEDVEPSDSHKEIVI